jgi:NADH-quinone oxidoreductase subunit N
VSSFNFALSAALLPQIFLIGFAAVVAVLGAVRPLQRPDLHRWIAVIALLSAIAAAAYDVWGLRLNPSGIAVLLWNGGLVIDRFSLFVTIVACVFALLVCLLCDTYLELVATRSAAFFSLLLTATAAAAALASQHEMITMFSALELLTLALLVIPAVVKVQSGGVRAAWMMLLEGAVATALLLYGFALLYGATGSTNLDGVPAALHRAPALVTLAGSLVLLGLSFPLGILPLRRWTERAADQVPAIPAAFVTVMAMTGGCAALLRADSAGLASVWHPAVGLGSVLAAVALAGAALLAVRETRTSRLVVIAGSSQAAFLVMAVIGTSSSRAAAAPTATLFGLAVFGLTSIAAFAVLAMLQTAGLGDRLADLRGLGHRSPGAAVLLAFALATLAGVPPLGGFVARLLIVVSAFDAGYGWLAVVALAAAVLTALPLIRVIAAMWAERGDEQPFTLLATPRLGRMVATFCCLGAFYVTVLAEPILLLARGGAGPVS